ncbi:PKD domain-containing protein [Muriicola sp. Z0-33]|uniref:PKD domain-containing protein n=1 Tax=Muriicola sp. Z0-33 TaxID=2816957 RepID=UPI002237198B|nr:PKD domain-containing protein [Muriicola sp. Z0-33]MCW5517862.1 PKD domain-containing protein [Muriicola sp. Z0-33]
MKQLLKQAKKISIFILAIAFFGCEEVENIFPDVIAGFTFTINADTGTVSFINISEEARTYEWDFGDGSSSTEINPIKTYTATGTYKVILKATNASGASATSEDDVAILIKEDVALPITFDNSAVDYEVTAFGGTAFEILDNPDVSGSNDTASNVGAITNSGSAFEGIFFDLGADIDLTTDKTISMNFWADAPIDVLVKLEEGTAAAVEATASHGGTGWEAITFDFVSSDQYSRLTLFVDGPGTTAGTFYLDDIEQIATPPVGGGPVPPTAGPMAPTEDAADVISIFSDSFTDVPNQGFNNYGAAAFEQVDLGGNAVLKYTFADVPGGNFQVIELGGDQIDAEAAGMTNFRFDLWFPNEVDAASTFLMKLVDIPGGGPTEGQIAIGESSSPAMAQGSWLNFDIPITELESNGLGGKNNIQQVVIDLMTAGEVYIDNIYFYKPAGGGGPIAPTAGPAAPTEDAADVISIFSDSYTDVPNQGFNNYGAAAFEQVDLGGNAALRYTFVDTPGGNFQVIELGGDQIDAEAAGMTNFRFDLWFPNEVDGASTFLMKLVDIPGGGPTEGQINISESSNPAMAQGSWLNFDIPFTELESNGLGAKSNIQQVVIDLMTAGEVYVDNIYFYKPGGGGGPVAGLPLDFEDGSSMTGAFDNGANGANADNPDQTGINTSAKVYQFNKVVGSAWYSGAFNIFAADIDPAGGTTFKMKIWSPNPNINVRFQLEKEGNQGPIVTYNLDQTVVQDSAWVELTFDFSTTALNLADGYDKIVIFPDYDESNQVDVAVESIYYIDDIIQE